MTFDIVRSQPSKRVTWRVYKDGRYVHTATRLKDAKRFVEWVKEKGVRV